MRLVQVFCVKLGPGQGGEGGGMGSGEGGVNPNYSSFTRTPDEPKRENYCVEHDRPWTQPSTTAKTKTKCTLPPPTHPQISTIVLHTAPTQTHTLEGSPNHLIKPNERCYDFCLFLFRNVLCNPTAIPSPPRFPSLCSLQELIVVPRYELIGTLWKDNPHGTVTRENVSLRKIFFA